MPEPCSPEAVSVRDYFEARVQGLQDQVDRRFLAAERAVAKAEAEVDHRLETMNAFRDQLQSERVLFVTRDKQDEVDSRFRAELAELGRNAAMRTAVDAYRRWLVGLTVGLAAAILVVLVNLFLNLRSVTG